MVIKGQKKKRPTSCGCICRNGATNSDEKWQSKLERRNEKIMGKEYVLTDGAKRENGGRWRESWKNHVNHLQPENHIQMNLEGKDRVRGIQPPKYVDISPRKALINATQRNLPLKQQRMVALKSQNCLNANFRSLKSELQVDYINPSKNMVKN